MLRIMDGTIEEVSDVCRLDKIVFSEKWDIPLIDGQDAWRKNNEIYRVIKKNDEIMGYHFVAPFSKEIFDHILEGQMDEKEAIHYILNYAEMNEVYLYIYSIVVDITQENYKEYSRPLLQDMMEIVVRLHSRSIIVKELGFIAISEAGVRIANRMGLNFMKEIESDEKPNPRIYRAKPEDFKEDYLLKNSNQTI
ncbi:MAG: hypothetical protein JWM44_2043 [Bacilli bacterium]|nr:hypothetical protein [Bacilli bacterium]